MLAFFVDIGDIEMVDSRLFAWKYDLLGFVAVGELSIVSNLVLFSFYDAPELMMAGSAAFAMLCGIVLMGGRSVVGLPLRVLRNFRGRGVPREPVALLRTPRADRGHEQDAGEAQHPLQHSA
jgi:hypothetical protein